MPKTINNRSDLIGLKELKTPELWKALAAELIGTLFLVLFGCASTLQGTDITKISLMFGFTLACMIQAIGHISGCHVNPSVTIAFLATRYISLTRTITYIIAQCIGGVLGSAILYNITPEGNRSGMGVTSFDSNLNEAQGFGVEVIATFILVFTIFGTIDERRTDLKGSASLAIGLACVVAHIFAIPYTGSSLNPARTFGPAFVVGGKSWKHHWVYWIAPPLGGILAGHIYKILFRQTKSAEETSVTGSDGEKFALPTFTITQ